MERKNNRENPAGDKVVSHKKWKGTRAYITNHGYVLIFSLWAIVIFGFIALSFTRNTGIAIKTEITSTERVKNVYAARGACIYATQMLLLPKKQGKETKGGKIKKWKKNKDTDASKKGKSGDPWTPSSDPYSVEIGDADCDVFISDEGGKINVNKVTDETRDNFIKFLTAYKLEEHTAEIITDSILDWLDEDDLHHVNGAEKGYYATFPEPYEPKNGPFESLEELTLVKGITPQIFELLRDHLTIYGMGKINVNFASMEVLLSVPTITEEIDKAMIKYRGKRGKIAKIGDLKEIFRYFGIIGADFQKIMNYLTVYDSNYMTINSISSSAKVKNSYKIVVFKSVDHCRIIAAYPE